MADVLLMGFLASVANFEEDILQRIADRGESSEDVDITFPAVTLILPGLLVSGNLVTYRTYKKRMQQLLESVEGEEAQPELGEVFLRAFYRAVDNIPEEITGETLPMKQIFLVNVTALIGERSVELPPMCIPVEAVQGWTFGEMSVS